MKRSLGILVCAILLAGCSASGSDGTSAPRELTVFAASSLTAAFTQIGRNFEARHRGVVVTFNFGPSDQLASQIESEGTADVFASASPTWMDDLSQKGPGVAGRANFAQNRLIVIVPPDNPAGITSFADLAKPDVKLVLAAEGVPVGDYARQALDNAGIGRQAEANVVSNEQDDASVVAKITSGEADAAIVYVSDLTAEIHAQVSTFAIPDELNVIATYPIAVVVGTRQPDLAKAFVEFVSGAPGQATLHRFGFLPAG